MAQPYIGQVFMFDGDCVICYWIQCSVQMLSRSQNNELFVFNNGEK